MNHHFPYPPTAPSLHLFGGEGWGGVSSYKAGLKPAAGTFHCQKPDLSVAIIKFVIALPFRTGLDCRGT
jgi:hypothetical protein